MVLKNSIIKLVEIARENLAIIIVIPTLLGGIWQVSQLILISPIFLRFFSISQLVSDGILVGFVILLCILIPYLLASSIANLFIKYDEKTKLTIATIFGVIYVVILFLDYGENHKIFRIMLLAYGYFQNYLFTFSREYRTKFGKLEKTLITILISVGIFSSFVDVINLMSEISKSSKNIENLKFVEQEIQKQNPCARIEYFNDKYIFIETDSSSSSKTYIIKKFEVFTEIELSQ